MITLITVLSTPFILWVMISTLFYSPKKYEYNSIREGRILRERTMTNYNFWALLFNIKDGHFRKSVEEFLKKDWKPKTGIDKEIAEEEEEIERLERQKEKIDRLAELKRRKERLFEEVNENGVTGEYTHCNFCRGENTLKAAITRDGISYLICTLCGNKQ